MNRLIVAFLFFLICSGLNGCDYIWDGLSRGATTKDFGETLVKLGTPVEDLECRMFETTRDFSCSGKMTGVNYHKLSSILKLSENELTHSFGNKICAEKAINGKSLLTSTSMRRPKELPGYEYLVTTFDTQTGEVCLESSNSYG